ncbi:MAG: YceI family protein [Pseudomonadota bacterium]
MKNVAVAAFAAATLAGCDTLSSVLVRDPEVSAVALREGAYELDAAHAALLFKVKHLGLSSYIGRFEVFEASLEFDSDDPTAARIEAVVDMTSLDIANDKFAETLMDSSWFDADTYPQAVFRSTRVVKTGGATGTLYGDLTLKGETHEIVLDVTFNGGARNALTTRYTVGFKAEGVIDRMQFGIDNVPAFVGSDVEIEIHAEFQRR